MPTPLVAPPPTRLPRRRLAGYGMGDVGSAAVITITGFYLTAYWLDVARLPAAYVGTILLCAQVWDAVTDPAVGILADRTRTRWGRKRPWLLFGAVPFAVAYVLQWVVPETGAVGLFWYYLAVSLLLRTSLTVVGIPYGALTPDLTRDYDERTRLNQYRFGFNLVAALLAISLHPVLIGLGGGGESGYLTSAAVIGAVGALGLFVAFRSTSEIPAAPADEPIGDAVRSLGVPFQSRAFRYTVGIFILSWTALLFVQNNLFLFVRYWVRAEAQFVPIILCFQVTAVVFLAVWGAVSKRVGKPRTYVYGVAVWAAAVSALLFLPRDVTWPYFVVATLAGAGASVAYLIPWSLLPDVIEEDAVRTGVRREGVYYAAFVFLQKGALTIGLAGSAYALGLAGYLNPDEVGALAEQPEPVLWTLRVIVSVVPAVILLASVPLALRYPISRERFAELAAQLDDAAPLAGAPSARPSR